MTRLAAGALAAITLCVATARADALDEVGQALDALNKAFAKGDTKAVAAGMTEDHLAVTGFYAAPVGREEQLKSIGEHKFTEYKAGKLKFQPLGPDAVLVTYEVTMRGTFKGKAVPTKNFASAVWVRRGGKWLEAFYQETPLPVE